MSTVTPIPQGRDEVLEALDRLEQALEKNASNTRVVIERIHELRKFRSDGMSWHAALEGESGPGTIRLMSEMLKCLSTASGELRQLFVVVLRSEGQTIPYIAKLFGVTHQRISNIIRQARNQP